MPCPSDSVFDDFVADRLSATREQQIVEHLETCEACRRRSDARCGGAALEAAKQLSATQLGDGHGTRVGDATHAEFDELRGDLYRLGEQSADGEQDLQRPSAELWRLLSAGPTDDVAGARLGRFLIQRWLGAGAFGVVFLAYDQLLHREVALKLPRAVWLTRAPARERFLREAEAAAQLHHPGVVPVFEAGEQQGVCYIATAYCPGPTLDAWLAAETKPVAIARAVELTRQLAEAVQHAHQHRVLHRDIKPSNILLHPQPNNPAVLTPKITDFGLAKLLDADASMTASQGMLGTPRYMAPEQAAGARGVIGPATDVFALGAVLYELLVGVAPYAADDHAGTLHRLLYEAVVPPRRLRDDVPADLQAICLKCLEKRPDRRYQTAQALADDLRRLQQGQATHARPLGRLELLRRWTVRQPAIAALLLVSSLGLLAVLGGFVAHGRSLEKFNAEIQSALDETRRVQHALEAQQERMRNLLYVANVELAHQAIEENDPRQAAQLLEGIRSRVGQVQRGFVWHYLWNQVAARGQQIDDCGDSIYELRFAASGKRLAAGGADSILRIYDGGALTPLAAWKTGQGEINGIAFSPDERTIATAGDDGTVRLWDARTGRPGRKIQAFSELAYGVLFTPDGQHLITCGDHPEIRLWDAQSGDLLRTLTGHSVRVESIALSPDGSQLASTSSDNTARLWHLASGQTVHVLQGHQYRLSDAVYSPDGRYLLTGSIDNTIRLWRTSDGVCLQTERAIDPVASVAWMNGNRQFVVGDRGGAVYVYNRRGSSATTEATAGPLFSWQAHQGRTWEVNPHPHQAGVLSAGGDGKIYYWQRPPAAEHGLHWETDQQIVDFAFDADCETLYVIDADGDLTIWAGDGQQSHRKRLARRATPDAADRRPTAISPLAGGQLAIAFDDATIEAFSQSSASQPLPLRLPWAAEPSWHVDDLNTSRDGRRLAAFAYAHDATAVFDLEQNRLLRTFNAYAKAMALSADGTQLTMSDANDIVVWHVDSPEPVAHLTGHTSSVVTLQFSPDGRCLASGSQDRNVILWDLQKKSPLATLSGHRGEVHCVAFSPDGQLLASGDGPGELKFWFLPEATELISIAGSQPIQRLLFSPDGRRLAVQTERQLRVLNAHVAEFSDDVAAGTDAVVAGDAQALVTTARNPWHPQRPAAD